MPLMPYEHFRHLDNWRNEFDRIFPGIFNSFTEGFAGPRIDVYVTDQEVVASCEIPGLAKADDVNIDVTENMLTISGSVNRSQDIKDEQLHRRERFSGKFQRTIALPAKVATEGTKARYKNGILEVHMPKISPAGKNRVNIEFEP